MGRPKRNILATAEETLNPPPELSASKSIARVVRAAGNNLYFVSLPTGQELLVELPARFRSTIWIRRGGFVLVDTEASNVRDNKINGNIENIVGDEKSWRKMKYWPPEFKIKKDEESDSAGQIVGTLPQPELDEED